MRTLLGKAKQILNYERGETIKGEVNRKAVVMVNLKDTMKGESKEVN